MESHTENTCGAGCWFQTEYSAIVFANIEQRQHYQQGSDDSEYQGNSEEFGQHDRVVQTVL
jgi:hypothetical protein